MLFLLQIFMITMLMFFYDKDLEIMRMAWLLASQSAGYHADW